MFSAPLIPGDATLRFEVELLDIHDGTMYYIQTTAPGCPQNETVQDGDWVSIDYSGESVQDKFRQWNRRFVLIQPVSPSTYILLPVYELLCPTIREDNFCRLRSFGSVSFLSQWTNFIRIGRLVVFRGRIGLEYLEGREMVYFIQNDISVSRLSVSFHIWSPILWAAQNKWAILRFVIISGWDLKDLIGINYKKKRKWGNFKLK